MPAYLIQIEKPNCPCGKAATKTVFNGQNQKFGVFCAACGARKVEEINEDGRAGFASCDY